MSASVQRKLKQAHDHLRNGDAASASSLCEAVLARAPRNPDALWLLGAARLIEGRAADALPLLARAVAAAPAHGAALEHLGLVHLMLEQYADAERTLRRALELPGAPATVRMRLGLALLHQARHPEAVQELERAAAADPQSLDAMTSLARAYAAQGRWADARRELERVIAQAPDDADTLYNLGVVAFEQRDLAQARVWLERCVARAPHYGEAQERLAAVYLALGRYPQAVKVLRAIAEAQPSNAAAANALAEATFQSGALDEALGLATKARDLDPGAEAPYRLLQQIHHVKGTLDRAVAVLEEGYARTRSDALLGALVHLTHRQCDWQKWQPAWERMSGRLDGASDFGSPFWLLCEETTPEQQLAYTRAWTAKRYPSPAAPPRAKRSARERVRVGYYSGDFHQHPVPTLLVEALELHDRSRFEVFAYSYGPNDGSAMRARLERSVEHFIDLAWDPDDVVEARVRSDDLDLLVDLKGYTAGDRLGVMAARPCALQFAWLGYPGTTGAAFIDYLIADPVIVPEGADAFYSERVLRLPHCYQANDRKRPRPLPKARGEYGLSDDAFVFCCFNQTVKITPPVYARWMSLLKAIPHGVLWLLEDNVWATRNLLDAAERSGAGGRVVVAPRVAPEDHLARYAAADLALDTFPYTSHTTGSDALWMGCPLVALCGETFTARVSSSLLVNAGLADLVTHTLDDYEVLALDLAKDPERMRAMRARAAAACDTAPLFDSLSFVRDLEALYEQVLR
jgi:predicted O-linked N-acetylglucosamine transferase (SPINDLY family)